MCIVSVCPKGTSKEMKDIEEFVRSGYKCNSSGGSGYMFKKSGDKFIYVRKGFFDVEKLIDSLKNERLQEDDELVIHHRIRTSGNIDAANTHPFVISNLDSEAKATNIKIDKPAIAHNGVFTIRHYEAYDSDMSDTYAFARYILSNKNLLNILYDDEFLFEYVMEDIMSYNKIAILHPEHDCVMLGHFYEDDGYYHSNQGYCTYVHNVGGVEIQHPKSVWDDDDDEDDNNFELSDDYPSRLAAYLDSIEEARAKREENEKKKASASNKNLTSVVTLDSTYLDLTNENLNHFRYTLKSQWDAGSKDGIFELSENASIDSELNTYTGIEQSSSYILKTISTEVLKERCYYIPKKEHLEVYKDYKDIIDASLQVTKSMYKKLKKRVSTHYNKPSNYPIKFTKLNKSFCLKAVQMYLRDMEIILEVDENINHWVPIRTALNIE